MSEDRASQPQEKPVAVDSNDANGAGVSLTAVPKKVVGKPFVKGQSGNPAGYSKAMGDLTALARSMSPQCVPILFSIISNERAAAVARVSAINLLWDRAYGKAAQPVDINLQADLAVLLEAGRRRVLGE